MDECVTYITVYVINVETESVTDAKQHTEYARCLISFTISRCGLMLVAIAYAHICGDILCTLVSFVLN